LLFIPSGSFTGIYPTSSVESCRHILESSKANIVIVDDAKQMNKIHELKDNLPHLKAVIQTQSPYANYVKREDGFWKWQELTEIDITSVEGEYQNRVSSIDVNDTCCLIYTSGTTGLPKGVILTNENLIFAAKLMINHLCLKEGQETFVSCLPASHIAGQMNDILLPILLGGTVYFADSDALKGTLVNTLQVAQPTFLFGVPRVYEKMQEKMECLRLSPEVMVRALGLSKSRNLVTGGAPTKIETKKFFHKMGVKMVEVYGMSETSGPHVISTSTGNFEASGKSYAGVLTKIYNPDEKGHGEICMKGRNTFKGYLNDEKSTRETIDEEGWVHSGDLGYIDDDGNVYITGRLKELIITSGGENIPPIRIENQLKSECAALSNVFLVGDRRKFLSILVSLKTELNDKGVPLDNLAGETLKWLKEMNLSYTKLSEVLESGPDLKIMQNIQNAIDRVNMKAISNAQKIQKFAILPHDFSIATGEFGPTMKLKRSFIAEKYNNIIEGFYE
jgi:long-chain-fatty-acid--CoA ligase ACSBG